MPAFWWEFNSPVSHQGMINMEDENEIEEFESAVIFREEQINKLVKKLKSLVRDKLLFQKMVDAGKKYQAAKDFSDDVSNELVRLIEDLE